MRVPTEHAEEAASEAFEKAAMGAFRGECAGEFHSWLNKIINGTAADWLRRYYRRGGPDGEVSFDDGGFEAVVVSESGAVELRLVTEEVLAEMNATHREVVELHVFQGLSAPEVCERIDGMSPDNVAKITSRFRQRMRTALNIET